jgi:hypothetical protein
VDERDTLTGSQRDRLAAARARRGSPRPLAGFQFRQLNRADFTDAMMNDLATSDADYAWSSPSDRLSDRLTA